jgi:hypothetical protein
MKETGAAGVFCAWGAAAVLFGWNAAGVLARPVCN